MKKRALLIGVNQYHLLGNLSFARQDAEGFAESLCKYCGFTDQDITLMTCQSEGASMGLSRYIEHALMHLTEERHVDLLIFGFWGHGFVTQASERYLCGIDTVENDLERSAVSMNVVKAKLAQVQAQNSLLVLDCCQNRSAGRSASADSMVLGEEAKLDVMARDIQAAGRKITDDADSIPTVAILNACREGQKAYEWEARKHGIFTAHLLDGLEEGIVSISQLSHVVSDRTAKTARDIWGQKQTPLIKIEGSGDLLLADGTASLKVSHTLSIPSPAPYEPPAVHHYCLECISNEGSKRILFFTGEYFSVGRANYTNTDAVDITLRVLPCESASKHPEEWRCNRIIASNHFAFRFYNGRFEIKANPQATNPLFLTRIDGAHTRHPAHQIGTKWEQLPQMSRLSIGNADVLPLQCVVLADAMGAVVALHVLRLNNASHIEYVFLAKSSLPFAIEHDQVIVANEHSDFQVTTRDSDNVSLTYTNAVHNTAEHTNRTHLPLSLPIKGINACVRKAGIDDFREL